MSITSAGIHANKLWNRAFRKMEVEGYTPPRKRKTLLDALSKARQGLSIYAREDLIMRNLAVAAGHRLVEDE